MTNPDYTAVMMVADRSGSMNKIRVSAEDAINEFIHAQAKQGKEAGKKRTLRIAQFDSLDGRIRYDTICPSTDPADIEPFALAPYGGTPLLDAMGRSIVEFGAELAALPEDERPGTVILAVMTDGEENSSVEYQWEQIEDMVRRQENEYGWQVLYLGANQDAIKVAARMGVRASRAMTYNTSHHGTTSMVGSINTYVASAAAGGQAVFTPEQREDAQK